jgi:hypothetical protein
MVRFLQHHCSTGQFPPLAINMTKAAQRVDLLPALQAPVRGMRGETLGRVTRLWQDPESGAIVSATLTLRKEADRHQLQINIPWSQFRVDDHGRFELFISRSVLVAVAQRVATEE